MIFNGLVYFCGNLVCCNHGNENEMRIFAATDRVLMPCSHRMFALMLENFLVINGD